MSSVQATNKDGNPINFCLLPKPVKSAVELQIYQKLIKAHCSHKDADCKSHACCGQITMNRKTVTMNCVKCGDSRINLTVPVQEVTSESKGAA